MGVTWVSNSLQLSEQRKATQARKAEHAEVMAQVEQAAELLRTDAR